MKSNKDVDDKRKLKFVLIAIIIGSLYFSVLLHGVFSGYGVAWGPISQIRCVADKGFPFGTFFILLLVLGGAALFAYYSNKTNADGKDVRGRLFRHQTDEYGYGYDSHFETPEEYKDVAIVQTVDKAYGTIFGSIDPEGKKLINFRLDENRLNQNIAVTGASGTGKTFTFVKPFCYQVVKRRESIVFTDPDGGLYRDLAGYLQDQGYVVRRFDLANKKLSDGWDCLKSIRPDYAEEDAQMFAQAVMSNVGRDNGIYTAGPMALLKALILRVYFGHDFPPETKNIGTVYNLLQDPAGEAFLDSMFDAESLTEDEKVCLGPYLSFKQGSPNLRGNLISNLAVDLQLLQGKEVRRVLSTDDIDLKLPAEQPCAYFCVFPDYHDTPKFIVSLFFSMFFITLIGYADETETGKLPVPVNFMLDEFPSIGMLPDWDRKMATIRKRNIRVTMIFQNIRQLMNLYQDAWVTILSNCSTMVAVGINDLDTADLWSKRIGETSVKVKTEQKSAGNSMLDLLFAPSGNKKGQSEGEGKRSLMTMDELQRLNKDELLIIFQGHNPIIAYKYPHERHPASKLLRTIAPKDIVHIDDEEGRKAEREKEKERIANFYRQHPNAKKKLNYKKICAEENQYNESRETADAIKSKTSSLIDKVLGKKKPEPKKKKVFALPPPSPDCIVFTEEDVLEEETLTFEVDNNGVVIDPVQEDDVVEIPLDDKPEAPARKDADPKPQKKQQVSESKSEEKPSSEQKQNKKQEGKQPTQKPKSSEPPWSQTSGGQQEKPKNVMFNNPLPGVQMNTQDNKKIFPDGRNVVPPAKKNNQKSE